MENVTDMSEKNRFFNVFYGAEKIKRFLYGINEYSDAIANRIEIDGYIDDYTDITTWNGKPVVRSASLGPDCWVVSCVTNSRPKTAMNKLRLAGVVNCIDYFAFAEASNGAFKQVPLLVETRSDYNEHREDYQWVRSVLHDEESKDTFDSIMKFRMTGDLKAINRFEFLIEKQYFDDVIEMNAGEVFIDGGGFDGYTSLEFARRCPEYAAIHIFEPSASALITAKQKLESLKCIHYHQLGLYYKNTILSFDSGAGSASQISEEGSEKIEVVALDEFLSGKTSFIKLDLEGAEMAALKGMRSHILNGHPKMAIAVYHRSSDIWEIPRYIYELRDDYLVYLRHYTEGWAESVMYFIPKVK